MVDFDPSTPGDSDNISDYPANERSERQKLEDWVVFDHYEADGKHRVARFKEQADPTIIADEIGVYAKVAAGKANLFIKDEDGNVIQLTEGGLLTTAAGTFAGIILAQLGLTVSGAALTVTSQPIVVTGGEINLDNNQKLTAKDVGGTKQDLIHTDGSDVTHVGDQDNLGVDLETDDKANVRINDGTTAAQILTAESGASFLSGQYFESTAQAITLNTDHSVAHGLGARPRLWMASLRCSTAEFGYAIGDDIVWPNSVSSARAWTAYANASNLGLVIDNEIRVMNRSTTAAVILTPGSWGIIFKGWK